MIKSFRKIPKQCQFHFVNNKYLTKRIICKKTDAHKLIEPIVLFCYLPKERRAAYKLNMNEE